MVRTLAIDGTEWTAADMTFDQDGRVNGILQRTQIWAGSSGVWTGGLVAATTGRNVSITGPLQFNAKGEMGVIASPANMLLTASSTLYLVAVYAETLDTPASYVASGSPPDLHVNPAPVIVARTSGGGGAAVEANHEVDLATVVVGASTITSVTDTRKILPRVDGSGNIVLGALKTVDGMDPSVHQALQASSTVLGHVKFGPGGATPYRILGGYWKRELFYDVGSTYSGSTLLDDADFAGVPASSEPNFTLAVPYYTQYLPTRWGDLSDSGYGPRVAARYTLTFDAASVFTFALWIGNWQDTVRVKANGTTLFSDTSASGGAGQAMNFNTVVGSNTIQVYLCNGNGNQYHLNLINSILNESGITFTG